MSDNCAVISLPISTISERFTTPKGVSLVNIIIKRELSDLSENRVNATLSRVCLSVCPSRNDQVE